MPFGVGFGLDEGGEQRQGFLAIAPHGHGGGHVFVDFGGVDVEVNHLSLTGVFIEAAGHPVIKTHADGDEHVALVGEHIGTVVAVHAQHAHVQRMVGGQSPGSQNGPGGRNPTFLDEGFELQFGRAQNHALPPEHERPLRLVDKRRRFAQVFGPHDGHRPVAANVRAGHVRRKVKRLKLCVFGDVNQHRAGPAAPRNVERLGQRLGNFLGLGHLVVPLGDGRGDVDDVGFLKGIGAQQVRKHLPRDANQRRAVNQRIGEAGDQVRSARPAGGKYHPHPTRRPRIALRRVHSALLMPHQHMVQPVFEVVERIVNRDDGPAGIAENRIHALRQQNIEHCGCARRVVRRCREVVQGYLDVVRGY